MIKTIICVIIYLAVTWDVIREAFEGIREGEFFGEEMLMLIASAGAMCIGEYFEAIAVIVLFRAGEWLEDKAAEKSRASITGLMNIRPDIARLEDGSEVSPETVRPGDIISVRPGESIPLDGIIVKGRSLIDTSSITGESEPEPVKEEDEAVSGCINKEGLLLIRVTKCFGESTVNKILELVENASETKSRSENFITKFSRIYTPAVTGAAVLVALLPPIIFGLEFKEWIYRALTFLVISCPCALVISVPLSFFVGLGKASREGILIKGSNYMDTVAGMKTCFLDKTGTLTTGETEAELPGEYLEPAAYAEFNSSHPVARAIVRQYVEKTGREIDPSRIEAVTEIPGKEVRARVDGREIRIGRDGLFIDGSFAAEIKTTDRIKEGASEALRELRSLGVESIIMLTGDKASSAARTAEQLGLDGYYAELFPGDKVRKVEEAIAEKKKGSVVFAGDGINDAPVLARADAGIAMGALGSDAAIEAADVVIMDDDIRKIPLAMKIAGKTVLRAKENIVFALAVKAVILVLGATGNTSMWAAVFADVGVALICILNAVR